MKLLVSTLAAATLMATPFAAAAQGHGGHGGFGGHGGMGGRGGFSHGGFASRSGFAGQRFGGQRFAGGGFAGRGFHGRGFGRGFFPFFGFGLGYALAADPWFYGPYWWDYGPYPPYAYDGDYYYDRYNEEYGGPPPPADVAPAHPAACGQWVWRPDQSRYHWTPGPCAAAAPAAAPPPAPAPRG